jgi:SAM-dependent methyltransferase
MTQSEGGVVVDRPLIVADVCALPFKDKVFDYAYTAHTLEHVEDIERALSELQRVAKRGCIIVPHWHLEGLWNYPYHLWIITTKGNKIIFRRKCRLFETDDSELRGKTKDLAWHMISRNREAFEVRYEWDSEIDYEVIRCGCEEFRPRRKASVERVVRKSLPLRAQLKRWARIAVTRFLRWWWARTGELNPKIRSSSPNLFAPYGAPTGLDIGSDHHEP